MTANTTRLSVVGGLSRLVGDFERGLAAANKSPARSRSTVTPPAGPIAFLSEQGMPTGAEKGGPRAPKRSRPTSSAVSSPRRRGSGTEHSPSASSGSTTRGEIAINPFQRIKPSSVPEAPVPVLSDDELRKLLAACEGAALSNAEAETPWLWLGPKGHLTDSGLRQMLERRGEQAGIGHVYPHQFRHTAAHKWLAADGGEGDLMMLMGWRSRQMLNRMAPARRKSERAQLINGWLFAGRCR